MPTGLSFRGLTCLCVFFAASDRSFSILPQQIVAHFFQHFLV